jgi:hypothetical protein
VAAEDSDPSLVIVLPDRPANDRSIYILFPEHVTVRPAGQTEGSHVYLFQPGLQGERPRWQQKGQSLQYEKDFKPGLHLLATAKLEDDGVIFSYEFTNRTNTDFELIYAPTDPRLTNAFHDERLERTYVHHANGFELLASDTPDRLTMSRDRWLPARYMASFTWPTPKKLVDRRDDGITYYNKSRPVDEPLIATLSKDGKWVVASFTQTTGNVWSNPELTCQHVDPQISIAPAGRATIRIKMLVFQGSLDDVLSKVLAQRQTLQ